MRPAGTRLESGHGACVEHHLPVQTDAQLAARARRGLAVIAKSIGRRGAGAVLGVGGSAGKRSAYAGIGRDAAGAERDAVARLELASQAEAVDAIGLQIAFQPVAVMLRAVEPVCQSPMPPAET